MSRLAAAAARACCGEHGCVRRRNLREIGRVPVRAARQMLAELGACEAGLTREDLIKVTRQLARSKDPGKTELSLQALRQMGAERMAPSLVAHNALLGAFAREGRWDRSLQLLLRMQQLGLEADEQSIRHAIASASTTPGFAASFDAARKTAPGASLLVEALSPQLEAARERTRKAEAAGEAASGSSWEGGARNAILRALTADAAAARSETGPGLRLLRERLAAGEELESAMPFRVALRACARSPERWREVLQITSMMEAWVRQDRGRAQEDEEVVKAYVAAIDALGANNGKHPDGQKEAALALLPRIEALGVPVREEVFTAAIRTCRLEGGDVELAHELLSRLRRSGLQPSSRTYAYLLDVYRHAGNMGERALDLLPKMRSEEVEQTIQVYNGILKACIPTHAQAKASRSLVRHRIRLGGERTEHRWPSEEEAAALTVGEMPLSAYSEGSTVDADGVVRGPDEGPEGPDALAPLQKSQGSSHVADDVADGPPTWKRALALLPQMRLRGMAPNAATYASAMELCSRAADLDSTLRLLVGMKSDGLTPAPFHVISALNACTAHGAYPIAMDLLDAVEAEVRRQSALVEAGDDERDLMYLDAARQTGAAASAALAEPGAAAAADGGAADAAAGEGGAAGSDADANADADADAGLRAGTGGRALGLFGGGVAPVAFHDHQRERLHAGTMIACSVGGAPLGLTLGLLDRMRERGLTPSPHAFLIGLDACLQKRVWEEVVELLALQREVRCAPQPKNYFKALRAFYMASPAAPWSATVALVEEVEGLRLRLPHEAELQLLRHGIDSGMGWDAVELSERIQYEHWEDERDETRLSYKRPHGEGTKRVLTGREALLNAERFVLAAQEGSAPERLSTLMRRLREKQSAPTPLLIKRALRGCRATNESRQGWRSVPALLQLARSEGLELEAESLVHALRNYEGALSEGTAEPADDSALESARELVHEVADLLNASPAELQHGTLDRLARRIASFEGARAHATALAAQLRTTEAPHDAALDGAERQTHVAAETGPVRRRRVPNRPPKGVKVRSRHERRFDLEAAAIDPMVMAEAEQHRRAEASRQAERHAAERAAERAAGADAAEGEQLWPHAAEGAANGRRAMHATAAVTGGGGLVGGELGTLATTVDGGITREQGAAIAELVSRIGGDGQEGALEE